MGASICVASELQLDSASNVKKLESSEHAYAVEFFSSMCGSCKEFSPTWKKFVEKNKKSIKFAAANIDTKEGMKFAQKMGALEEGIPNVKVFKGSEVASIVKGDVVSYKQLESGIKKALSGLSKDGDGFYLRAGDEL